MSTDSHLFRILDANANRAREGLRMAEDYVRFGLGDLRWAERLRQCRQALTETLLSIPDFDRASVASRNVTGDPLQPENWKDVLRRVDTETPQTVARRGLKRAQEAFRVLEEYLRASNGQQSDRLSKLRYGAYEAEQWLTCASVAMQIVQNSKVYLLVTEELCKNKDAIATVKSVLKGGIRLIQLREKCKSDLALKSAANALCAVCADFGAAFFCNDRVDLALLTNASGVHLGQDDLSTHDVWRLAGRRLLIGRSTHNVEQARHAVEVDGADCIGIGAMFETRTKSNPEVGGLKLAEDVSALKLPVPVFAIGGITFDRLDALKSAGICRIAVSQAIIGSASPEYEAQRFVEKMAV